MKFAALLVGLLLSSMLAHAQESFQGSVREREREEPLQERPGVRNMGRLGWWLTTSDGALELEERGEGDERVGPFMSQFPLGIGSSGPSIQGLYRSVQVNVDRFGRNILGDAANEPSMAMDPNNRNRLAVGWRQFNSVLSSFRQSGYGYSANGGTSWTFPGLLERDVFRSDPVLASDAAGQFYYLSLRDTFYDDYWRSVTGGSTWARLGFATGGDKQWLTIDRTNSPGRGFSYQYWSTAGNNYEGRQFSRSINGRDWMDPIYIPGSPIWGTLDVAKNGDLYLAGLSDPFSIVRSRDAKNALVTPTFDLVQPVNLGGGMIYGAFLNPVGLAGQVWVCVDKSNGPNAGNIYMLCSVGVDQANPCQVNFVRSTDGGRTWSAPIAVNDDAPGRGAWHWFGTMSVAPNGRIDVCWYDNRANPTRANSALYYSSSRDGGRTWTKSNQISNYFDPTIGYPQQAKMGDYMAMVSDNGGANIAYAATFNNEEDIWFVRVPSVQAFRPDWIQRYQGRTSTGSVIDVWDIDSRAYRVESTTLNGLGLVSAAEAEFTVGAIQPDQISVNLRAKTSLLPCTGGVWFYNYRYSRYDVGTLFPLALSLTDAVASPSGTLADYVSAQGKVRVVVRGLIPSRVRPGSSLSFDVDFLSLNIG
ncbi:MAG: sialidase family protein [Fimbriimonas sp.]